MATFYNNKIITDGIEFYLDAANPKCYPGSGSYMYDLIKGDTGTITGDVTISNGEIIIDQDTNVSSVSGFSLNLSSTNHTVMTATRWEATDQRRLRILSSVSNNWLLGHWNGRAGVYYANGWVNQGNITTGTEYQIYTGTGDIANDEWKNWVNLTNSHTNSSGSEGPNGISIGRNPLFSSENSDCRCRFVLIYNRVLTDEEIAYNYQQLSIIHGL